MSRLEVAAPRAEGPLLQLAPPPVKYTETRDTLFRPLMDVLQDASKLLPVSLPQVMATTLQGKVSESGTDAADTEHVHQVAAAAPERTGETASQGEENSEPPSLRFTPAREQAQERSVLVKHTTASTPHEDPTPEVARTAVALPPEPKTPDVRVSDWGDRLAIRMRPFARLKPAAGASNSGADSSTAVATDQFSWLHVRAESLLLRLEALAEASPRPIAQWARTAHAELVKLHQAPPTSRTQAVAGVERLLRHAHAGKAIEEEVSPADRDRLQLVRAALIRRAAVWAALVEIQDQQADWQLAGERFFQAVQRARFAMASAPQGREWEAYLLFDELQAVWEKRPQRGDKHLRHVIEQLVDRFDNPYLSAAQREMFAKAPYFELRLSFGDWAAATVDLEILCKAIEAHEARGGEVYAKRIAADARLLSLSTDSAPRQAAGVIDRFYRAPNLRLSVSRDFLQRLIPEQPLVAEAVRDTIAGAAVAGKSLTETDVRVVLIPDPHNWRIGLEVSGNVAAATTSNSGPATLHSAARTKYLARKLVVLTPRGLYSFPAVAGAEAENMLRAVDTSFDGIPLIEGLVRSIVVGQHEKARPQALAEVESKVSYKARQRLDSQLDERMHQAAVRVRQNVWNPLVELDLRPDAVELQTTEERLVAQARLAADRQLAAHTPRPLALADSLLSVQLHQSVANNLLEQLELAGRDLTLPELYQEVAAKLGRGAVEVPEDLSPTARIHFARHDPVVVSFQDGRVRITLSLLEVKDRRQRFSNFKVHAYYRPQVQGLQAQLVRDGIIEIEGRDLRPGDYMVLQGVFVSLFSNTRPLPLFPEERGRDPRLLGLMITQMVLEEGWLALAIGPAHPRRATVTTRALY